MITVRRDHLVTRVIGTAMGVGFLALGVLAIRDGVIAFGVTSIVAGVAAVVGSLIVADPTRIW